MKEFPKLVHFKSYYALLFLLFMVIQSCGTVFKHQTHQTTSKVKESESQRFNDSCEIHIIKNCFEMLSQTRSQWEKIDFSNNDGIYKFIYLMNGHVSPFTKGRKNYLKIVNSNNNKEYKILETKFYSKLLDFLSRKESGLTHKNIVDFFLPWFN